MLHHEGSKHSLHVRLRKIVKSESSPDRPDRPVHVVILNFTRTRHGL
jgi:hypothetical protein